jgi:hypothetical protein
MSLITTINSGDVLEPTSRNNINTNFANLNADKQEKPIGAVANNIVLFGAGNVLVDSGKSLPTGNIVGTSDAQVLTNKDLSSVSNVFPASLATLTGAQTLTNKNLTAPTIGDFSNANHSHQNAAGGGTLVEAALSLSDIATNNASAAKHGFLPKLSGSATDIFYGDGAFRPGATDVQIFTTPGVNTWTKPVGAKWVQVNLIAGAGGGGSGRKGAAGTVRCGGGAGGAGGITVRTFNAAFLGSTEVVIVGAGGTGGVAQSTNSTNGNNGNAGFATAFGGWAKCSGGNGGNGGSAAAGAGGTGGSGHYPFSASNGENASTTGGAGTGAGLVGNITAGGA